MEKNEIGGERMNSLLIHLLKKVNRLFHLKINEKKLKKLNSHSFVLYNHQGYWGFRVINDWYKWYDKGYKTDFGLYKRPEHAVLNFLCYVKKNKIKVRKLMN